jgi:S-adenosylmethionine hydrolase
VPVISLMTDFGIKDGTVGVMKGVIWSICPEAQISDLSHMIPAQNIAEAGYILARSAPYYPAGSIHVVVVDPGVGTKRRPMAANIGDRFFVGPDNGIITAWLERAEASGGQVKCVELNRSDYWLPKISHVFHGRDIFSPVAAHLANGTSIDELGTTFDDPVRIELRKPQQTGSGWRGEIIHIDHFGNISSNIREEHLGSSLEHNEAITVRLNGLLIQGLVNTFGERAVGELIALLGSTGNLGISVVNGNAAAKLGVKIGDELHVDYQVRHD